MFLFSKKVSIHAPFSRALDLTVIENPCYRDRRQYCRLSKFL